MLLLLRCCCRNRSLMTIVVHRARRCRLKPRMPVTRVGRDILGNRVTYTEKSGFYGVRAPSDIVGEQRVYDNWPDVQALAILNADPRIRAAMAGNYRYFDTKEEAEEFAASDPIIYPQFLTKKWRDYLRFTAILLGILLLSLLTVIICDQNCGWWQGMTHGSNFCNACVDLKKILKDYTLSLYGVGGTVLATALGGMVNLAFKQL